MAATGVEAAPKARGGAALSENDMTGAALIADDRLTAADLADAWKLSEKQTKRILNDARITEDTRSGSRGGRKRFNIGTILGSDKISTEKKSALLKGSADMAVVAREKSGAKSPDAPALKATSFDGISRKLALRRFF